MRKSKKAQLAEEAEKLLTTNIVDIDSLPDVDKIIVTVNSKQTPLSIGDKIIYPAESGLLKTVTSMTVFEDGSVNYMLKWFDNDFKSEAVSLTDLKILKQNALLMKTCGYGAPSK